jgi:hypothetical protein
MSTNLKVALAAIPVCAFLIYQAYFIVSFDKRIRELEESVLRIRRDVPRSELSVSWDWPKPEYANDGDIWINRESGDLYTKIDGVETVVSVSLLGSFSHAIDGILAWVSELSASISNP